MKTKSNHKVLRNLHVWGCPAYVLDPKLRDGSKLPKWEPESKWGQFLGNSPIHASTVRLILNLQTGNVSPQYHVVYDDFYETVHSNEDEPPAEWSELFTLNRFNVEYEDEGYIPELANEWKSPEELQAQ